MLSRSIVPAPKSALTLHQALELTNVYLENAYRAMDSNIALVLCHDAEVALSQAKSANKKHPIHPKDPEHRMLYDGMTAAYIDLEKLLERQGYQAESQAIRKKAEKWGGNIDDPGRFAQLFQSGSNASSFGGTSLMVGSHQIVDPVGSPMNQGRSQNMATLSHIFSRNVRPFVQDLKLPEPDERLASTPQLACCLELLQTSLSLDDLLEPAHKWLEMIEKDIDEQDRLKKMALEVVRAFKRDELKDAKAIAEVVYLAPVLSKDTFQDLLREFYMGIDQSGLLNVHQLEGIAQLIQGSGPGYLDADDLVKILGLLSTRLQDTHKQSTSHLNQLTLAVSHVLDAMADTNVTGLDREKLHEPLSNYLGELKKSPDPYLVYQAAYAYQALLCVPDDETVWQAAIRRTGKVISGVSGLVSAVKGVDLNQFIEGLKDIQKGLAGMSKVAGIISTAYNDVAALTQGGQGFLDSLKEGFSFEHKRDWYSALRGADALIETGELVTFRDLVCNAPCRLDPAFQWGVCQRLGEIAGNPTWDSDTRQDAIAFLGEIYRNDGMWGQHVSVKQLILNILMQLSTSSGTTLQIHATVAGKLLQELETVEDDKKKTLYRVCRENGPIFYPTRIIKTEMGSPSLLDRVQNRSDVEGNMRLLRKQRIKERGNAVYIPPQAKASLQAADDTRFLLMEKVKEFIDSNQTVFLILGDSGAGKSTFSRELEFELWQSYKAKTGRIPLHINLPSIDKPEHDMIAKQLRRAEFSEQQIREMKHYRKFILICDGYDESQQTHNLYTSNRLNQQGEWNAQMVISCRTEYLGVDYRDRFQPGNRNQQSDSSLFQEAVVTPFSFDQSQAYIKQYITLHQPLWQLEDYKQALEHIPNLKDLVRNPFLMALTLEVLPRMVDPGQNLSATQVTRVGLYDRFVEQWLERGKKRITDKDLTPQSRAVFERLSDEGFTQNGIDYLKKLAVAIYKEQGGKPIVGYSQFKDEGSWKDAFFLRKDKQLLREACPLTRNGNQHRFIHRSILEYGLALAVFDPHDETNMTVPEAAMGRRGSVSSVMSIISEDGFNRKATAPEQEPDINSPLVWRTFVNDHSLLQFLEERAKQEPLFKQQLFDYIELSKKDKKWRKAAANAVTILVRAGVQFIGADLRGIRIPRADLSYGVFDSAKLQDADLRMVKFRGTWLRQTDLRKAQMAGAQFGEVPFLEGGWLVFSCAYSPDGKTFVAGLHNGDINVYTTSNWERIRTFSGHISSIQRVVYSPRGDQIASCSEDGTVRLWDPEAGSLQHILTDHGAQVRWVAYSHQGNQVASANVEGTIRIWDVVTGVCHQALSGHTGEIFCVAFSPNDQQIASGDDDHMIRLWNAGTGDCSHTLSGHNGAVAAVAYSPRGDQVASASADTTIRLWNVETWVCSHILSGHITEVYSIVYSPEGGQLASGGGEGTVRIWDVEAGHCRQILTGHNNTVYSVVYSPRGDQIAASSGDSTVRLWDISAEASRFVSSGHSREVCSVKCSPNGELIVSGSSDSTMRLWDANTGACRRIISGLTQEVFSIAIVSQGDRIALGSFDKTVRLWNMETGDSAHAFYGHRGCVHCVASSPHGDMVASASEDKTVLLWDVETGERRGILDGHTYGALGVMFSPDGSKIATCSKDCTVRIWEVDTWECSQILVGHTNWVRSVAYSPQGNQLASAGYDTIIRLWDAEAGECSRTLTGHNDRVRTIDYSKQGDLLASGSWDGIVRLWDVATGQCRAEIQNIPGSLLSIAWSTDGTFLVTGSEDGSVLRWDVTEKGGLYNTRLRWLATNGTLAVTGTSIQDARGLTGTNKQLLKQRGAIGEPEHLLRETSKKLTTMTSVVSKLKESSDGMTQDSSSSIEQPGQHPDIVTDQL
ncbi:MAG: WD40-repeat-containing domain protein [Benniella sp.]|nr:MAG: WD40-repeat-containing domain protein [Benniella sp.]